MTGFTKKLAASLKKLPKDWPPRIRNTSPSGSIGAIREITEDEGTFDLNELEHQLVVRPRSAVVIQRIDYEDHNRLSRVTIWGRITEVGPTHATFRIEENGIPDDWPEGLNPMTIGVPVHIAPTYFAELDWAQFDHL